MVTAGGAIAAGPTLGAAAATASIATGPGAASTLGLGAAGAAGAEGAEGTEGDVGTAAGEVAGVGASLAGVGAGAGGGGAAGAGKRVPCNCASAAFDRSVPT